MLTFELDATKAAPPAFRTKLEPVITTDELCAITTAVDGSGEVAIDLQIEEVAQVPSDAWWSLPELPHERVRRVAREAQEALLLIHSDERSFNAIVADESQSGPERLGLSPLE